MFIITIMACRLDFTQSQTRVFENNITSILSVIGKAFFDYRIS